MLRRMIGPKRFEGEQWVAWIKRATRKVVLQADQCKVRNWTRAHAMMKWSWAGHVARKSALTGVWTVTTWRDSDWNTVADRQRATFTTFPAQVDEMGGSLAKILCCARLRHLDGLHWRQGAMVTSSGRLRYLVCIISACEKSIITSKKGW